MGLQFSSLLYFNAVVYDVDWELNGLEHNPNNSLPIVLGTIMCRREKIEVFGNEYDTRDGSCILDYVHAIDLAEAHLWSLDYLTRENLDMVENLVHPKSWAYREFYGLPMKYLVLNLTLLMVRDVTEI